MKYIKKFESVDRDDSLELKEELSHTLGDVMDSFSIKNLTFKIYTKSELYKELKATGEGSAYLYSSIENSRVVIFFHVLPLNKSRIYTVTLDEKIKAHEESINILKDIDVSIKRIDPKFNISKVTISEKGGYFIIIE
jgi:hypothetical protein